MSQFEDAAKDVADEVTRPRPEGEEEMEDVQIMLSSITNSCSLRHLKVIVKTMMVKLNEASSKSVSDG